jgi:hypothetical protein
MKKKIRPLKCSHGVGCFLMCVLKADSYINAVFGLHNLTGLDVSGVLGQRCRTIHKLYLT